jgi:hypothetical protein
LANSIGSWFRCFPDLLKTLEIVMTEKECSISEIECRQSFIDKHVNAALDDLLSESLYWQMPAGGTEPLWVEMRDAIMAKVFACEHEMGRQGQHSEQVRENCI